MHAMKKILLFGSTGQLGSALQRSLQTLGRVTALSRHSTDYCADFMRSAAVADTVLAVRPDIIVNASAYTNVDLAESSAEQCHTINAISPMHIAQAASKIGAIVVHYSTDYVFDGSGSAAWKESDPTGPLNVYGESKLAGEQAIAAHCQRHFILRTSWVYAAQGNNFANTMLRLARERTHLRVVSDQIGAPTGALWLAETTQRILQHVINKPQKADDLWGLYHACPSGETSWHGFAQYVFEQARAQLLPLQLACGQPEAIATSAYPSVARRPLNSRLDCSRLCSRFELQLPPWQEGVAQMLAQHWAAQTQHVE